MSIGESDIAEIVADWTSIPVSKISEDESDRLLKLEDTLHQPRHRQNEAVSAVARAIKARARRNRRPERPIGSFIFLGPPAWKNRTVKGAARQCSATNR